MQTSLMHGISEKDMQAVINTYTLKDYFYPTLFPLKENKTLDWKMLEAQTGLRIAADLVARGSTINRKTREAISRIEGKIPKLSISRELLEDELEEYDIMVALSSDDPDLKALVEFWAEDTNFCWYGIANRAEWIALKQISLGKVKFSNSNNAQVVTEYDVDYQMAANQKIGVATSWATGTGAKPFSKDFKTAVTFGKKVKKATYRYAFMNTNTLALLVQQEEAIKGCASYVQNLTGTSQEPDLAAVNAYLAKKVDLNGIQIIPIDQEITIELANGERITENPFEDNVILFSESKILGRTHWKKPVDLKSKNTKATMALRGHTCVKKYSEEEPLKEVTIAVANLFPAWNLAGRSLLMQVDSTTWNKK